MVSWRPIRVTWVLRGYILSKFDPKSIDYIFRKIECSYKLIQVAYDLGMYNFSKIEYCFLTHHITITIIGMCAKN